MEDIKNLIVNIVDVRHVHTSKNGNPTYEIVTDDWGKWRTETDAAVGYEARNYYPRKHMGEKHVTAVLALRHIRGQWRVIGIVLPDGSQR